MGTITDLRYWSYKVLPLAYDDSLSYYEVVDKVANKLNEIINATNDLPENISAEVKKQLGGDGDIFDNLFNGLISAIATKESDKITYTPNDKQGGEIIWLGDTLYEVITPMQAGVNYIIGTNIVPVNITNELNKIKECISSNNEYYHARAEKNHDTQTYLFWKDKLYRVDTDIKTNDILSEKTTLNGVTKGQLTPVTIMDEVTAHYLEMHESDNALQTSIDNNANDISNLKQSDIILSNNINTNNNQLNSRIDNIIGQSNNDNTEIVDGRKEASKLGGTIATSIGEAIRNQVSASLTSLKYNQTNSDGKLDLNLLTQPNVIQPVNSNVELSNAPEGVLLSASWTYYIINLTSSFSGSDVTTQYFIKKDNRDVTIWYREYNSFHVTWSSWRKIRSSFPISNYNDEENSEKTHTVDLNTLTDPFTEYEFNSYTELNNAPNNLKTSPDYTTYVINIGTHYNSNNYVTQFFIEGSFRYWKFYYRVHLTNWTAWRRINDDVITIGKGTDAPTLRGNIEWALGLSDESRPITIIVTPGLYDLTDEFKDVFTSMSGNGINLNGYGRIIFSSGCYVKCNYKPTGNEEQDNWVYTNFSPFYKYGEGNLTIEGLNIEASNCRYCIHDDTSSLAKQYYVEYNNCIMKYTRSAGTDTNHNFYMACIGGGLGQHTTIKINGGIYECVDNAGTRDAPPITYHNGGNSNCDNRLYYKNVLLPTGHFRFGYYGESTHKSIITITGCKTKSATVIEAETADSKINNFELYEWNNIVSN